MMIDKNEITIRKAIPGDCPVLTDISFSAKRLWNYPDSYFKTWKNELTITADYVLRNIVFAALHREKIIGYYSVVYNSADRRFGEVFVSKGYWMEHIFINPGYINQGVGTMLIEHMKKYCGTNNIHSLNVFVDPHAEGFYKKTGATFRYMSKSNIRDREIPVYEILIS